MMSPRLRRVVLDPAPLLQNGAGLFIWLIVALITGLWMTGKGSPNIIMVFSTSVVAANYTLKTPIWRILPLTRAELGKAQWWRLLGVPVLCVAASLALAAAAAMAFGTLRTPWPAMLAYGGAELTLIALFGAAMLLSAALAAPFGVVGYAAGLGLPLCAAFVLGVRWIDRDLFAAHQGEMLAGGAAALALIGLLYLIGPWLPLARPKPLADLRARSAGVRRSGAPGLTGWNALLRPMLDRLALAALLSLLAVAFIAVLLKGLTGQDMPGLLPIAAVPPAALAIVTQGQIPARALAGLPLTPLARAVALHTIAPLMQIPVFALMCALMAVTAPGALTPAWLAAYGVTMLGLLAVASLSAGINLRFGQKGMALMVGVLGMIVGLASGYMAARNEAHPAAGSGVTAPAAALLLILPLVAGWVWTWAELAYGRAAYRHRPPSTPYWRGRGV